MLPNPGPAAHRLRANSRETRVGRNRKLTLCRRLATGGEGGLPSENQLPLAPQGTGAFKGEFRGCRRRERNSTVSSEGHLETSHVVV